MVFLVTDKSYCKKPIPIDLLNNIIDRAKKRCNQDNLITSEVNPAMNNTLDHSIFKKIVSHSQYRPKNIWNLNRTNQKRVIMEMQRLNFIKIINRNKVTLLK